MTRRPRLARTPAVVRRIVVAASVAAAVLRPASAPAQTPARSFADLRTHVRVGDRLIVRTTDGRKAEGRLVAIADRTLDLQAVRVFRRSQLRTLDEGTTTRIEIRDSTLNGGAIGLAAGGAIAVAGCAYHNSRPDDLGCGVYLLAALAGLLIGESVDAATNRPIFVASGGTTTSVAPIVGPRRVGLAAQVRF